MYEILFSSAEFAQRVVTVNIKRKGQSDWSVRSVYICYNLSVVIGHNYATFIEELFPPLFVKTLPDLTFYRSELLNYKSKQDRLHC